MVNPNGITRRDWLAGTGASLATLAAASAAPLSAAARLAEPQELPSESRRRRNRQSRPANRRPHSPHEVVARGPLRYVHSLGSVQHTRPRRMGDGK